MSVTVHHGDCREVLSGIADATVDACVTDPPYALLSIHKRFANSQRTLATEGSAAGPYQRTGRGFMGQRWDTGETAFDPAFWVEVLRVLKPGAHVVAFSGTRTYHRLACAIEDAGFEIRDQLAWCFGSGFPKSHNQKGEWAGWGTALKPAWEPICLARKPLVGTVAGNLAQHGCGALNIDGCRIEGVPRTTHADGNRVTSVAASGHLRGKKAHGSTPAPEGRWPANIIHDGSDEVVGAFPQTVSGGVPTAGDRNGDVYGEFAQRSLTNHGPNEGSAARFFYAAKAGPYDRFASKHPTVKPVELMRWLVRLVTPPGGTVLDPFAGTGTTGAAAMVEGFDCILIEREAQFVSDIERRIAWMKGEGPLTDQALAPKQEPDAGPLFSGEAA